jgi:ribonuclease G
MGGIVVIDFIDMRSMSNRKRLFDEMKEFMKTDRAKHTILPVSKFGLMQITRQRVRQEIVHDTSETCPVCNGTGEISKGVLITEDIRRKIETALREPGKKTITLKVHPFVHAYFTQGFISERLRWFLKFGKWVNLHAVENYVLNQYEIE